MPGNNYSIDNRVCDEWNKILWWVDNGRVRLILRKMWTIMLAIMTDIKVVITLSSL